jgi:hypothetical protein
MAGELEVIGDLATGALAARAVEPSAGEGTVAEQGQCLNCSGMLQGAHCHQCGQKAKVHRTLHAFGADILHSVLHFDGKIWRTLPLLFWHPGKLTRRYVEGERAKFVSPMALFLFTVFLSFAVFGAMLPSNIGDVRPNLNGAASAADTLKELERDKKELLGEIENLKKEKAEAIADGDVPGSYAWIDGEIARNQEALKKLESVDVPNAKQAQILEARFLTEQRKLEAEIARTEAKLATAKAAGNPTAGLQQELDGAKTGLKAFKVARSVAGSGIEKLEFGAGKATESGNKGRGPNENVEINFAGIEYLNNAAKHAMENPQLLLYKVQSNAYKYSWALIPISLPFVWLLFFWKRRFKMFDHAVFITYSISFMMMLAVIGGVTIATSAEGSFLFVVAICALVFLPPIHMYRQVHHAYQTSRFGALWRTSLLSMFAITALSLFTTMIVAIGVTV